jgi:uncharacterized protein YjiS (DUF1127 family)
MTLDTARGILLAPPGLFTRVRIHLAQRDARRRLRDLDDHLLRDIGISRADLELRRFVK